MLSCLVICMVVGLVERHWIRSYDDCSPRLLLQWIEIEITMVSCVQLLPDSHFVIRVNPRSTFLHILDVAGLLCFEQCFGTWRTRIPMGASDGG